VRLEFSWGMLHPLWQHPGLAVTRIRAAATQKPIPRSRIGSAHGAGHASEIGKGSLTSESAATGESQFAMDCNGKRNMLYFDMRPYIAPYFDRHGGFSTDEALR